MDKFDPEAQADARADEFFELVSTVMEHPDVLDAFPDGSEVRSWELRAALERRRPSVGVWMSHESTTITVASNRTRGGGHGKRVSVTGNIVGMSERGHGWPGQVTN